LCAREALGKKGGGEREEKKRGLICKRKNRDVPDGRCGFGGSNAPDQRTSPKKKKKTDINKEGTPNVKWAMSLT